MVEHVEVPAMRIVVARIWVGLSAIVGCAAVFSSWSVTAQSLATPSFTAAQATQGKAVYDRNCLSCHGTNLDDGQFGPPLKGVEFRLRWGGKPLDGLFGEMMRMPPAAPGSLGEGGYVQLLAFLARENGVLAGTRALPGEPAALRAVALPAAIGGPSGGLTTGVPIPPAPPRSNPLDRLTPVTDLMLSAPADGEWLTWRRSFDAQGFSPLSQVTRENVGELRLAWSWAMNEEGSNQPMPLVHNGVIYLGNTANMMQALDAATGDLIWENQVGPNSIRGFGAVRNTAIYGTNVFMATNDSRYCSPHCETAGDTMELSCDCGHASCGGKL